ncbi:MAG TPA: iron-sulfur cluster repair di-iron protein [Fibrobacteria bacterium]|nr:iron-sulfur cluster repair di-iron protein [Fibrobacteria bacterium]
MNPESTIGTLVAQRPSRSKVFERHGIDYCCGGKRSIGSAASEANIDLDALIAELERDPGSPVDRDWQNATVAEIVRHVLAEHHAWLRENLPRISALTEKVAQVHGAHAPSVVELRDAFEAVRADLEPHLEKEERVLFPAALRLEETGEVSLGCHAQIGASLEPPMARMEEEHREVGALLAKIKDLTDDFRPPPQACNTWRACYDALSELDSNTRAHIHLENEALHPRIRALQEMA